MYSRLWKRTGFSWDGYWGAVVECLSSHAPQKKASGLLSYHWLVLCLCTCVWVLSRLLTTAARDMSVNVVERDLNHIVVTRYESVWYGGRPDGRVQEKGLNKNI